METTLGKTQCLICHRLPIVPLSSGDLRTLPTQPQEAKPLLRQKEGTLKEGLQDQRETQPCPWGHRGGT